MEVKHKYCRECGSELIKEEVDANKVKVHTMDSGGGCWTELASKFDPATGKISKARVYTCPRHERKWYGENSHDIFCEHNGFIENCIKTN